MVEERITDVQGMGDTMQAASGGDILVEDIFPALDISAKGVKEKLAAWFMNDLTRCVDHVQKYIPQWDKWAQMYNLEAIERYYANIGGEADFASGLLCEKAIEARDRLKRAIFRSRPMHTIDGKTSGIDDVDMQHRLERFIDTYMRNELKVPELLGKEGLYDFIVEGSLIVEIDNLYKVIPQKGYKLYTSIDALQADEPYFLDRSLYDDAYTKVGMGEPVRMIVEKEVVEHPGLKLEIVDKRNHLIPPGVYKDVELRFRARRYHFTKTDLLVLSSPSVNWYKRADINEVIAHREQGFTSLQAEEDPPATHDEMRADANTIPLGYDWNSANELLRDRGTLPYRHVFPIYRITAKYGYPTQRDKHGLIPKLCVFDFCPDTQTILRARVYPHLQDNLPWFHYKLGYKKGSYYGYGFGALLYEEDARQTSLLNLFLDGAAKASSPPSVSIHPSEGGIIPFRGGMAPGQVGFVRQIGDFKALEVSQPAGGLLERLYPISMRNAENRVSVTSSTMGQIETGDPRSSGVKTQMLLGEARVGMEAMLDEWAEVSERMTTFIQQSLHETALILGVDRFANIVESKEVEDLEGTPKVALSELALPVIWCSQASVSAVNPEARKRNALQHYTFFMPILQQLAPLNPELFLRYYLRWMLYMAEEMEMPQIRQLIPTQEEVEEYGPQMAMAAQQQAEGQRAGGEELTPPQPPPGFAGPGLSRAAT